MPIWARDVYRLNHYTVLVKHMGWPIFFLPLIPKVLPILRSSRLNIPSSAEVMRVLVAFSCPRPFRRVAHAFWSAEGYADPATHNKDKVTA